MNDVKNEEDEMSSDLRPSDTTIIFCPLFLQVARERLSASDRSGHQTPAFGVIGGGAKPEAAEHLEEQELVQQGGDTAAEQVSRAEPQIPRYLRPQLQVNKPEKRGPVEVELETWVSMNTSDVV